MQLKPNSPTILKVLAAAMLLVFAAGGLWLLFLAFEIGDVYPPYSSHRAELDGTEVLYEALDRFSELRVARHYGPAGTVPGSTDTTIIVAGVSPSDWHLGDEGELRDLIGLADQGARLVMALQPSPTLRPLLERATEPKEAEPEEKGKPKKPRQPIGERLLRVSVNFGAITRPTTSHGRTVKQTFMGLEEKSQALPERLPWRGRSCFEPRDPAWKTVYSWNGQPVLLHKPLGKGNIILIADSFLLTNQAMWEARHPEFLAWLLGGSHAVLFYERHLGVAEDPGVVWLIRRYHLDGVVAALLMIVALFVWRNSVALVPVRSAEEEAESVLTMTRGSSLLALVSRSLPAAEVLQVCVDEWKKTERPSREIADRIEKLAREKGDMAAVYRQIVKQLRSGPRDFDAARRPAQTTRHSTAGETDERRS